MKIYVFSSFSEPSIKYYTCDPTGGNLPADYAPWRDVTIETTLRFSDPMARAMHRDGYFCVSGRDATPDQGP
jgi:hypothetical protein